MKQRKDYWNDIPSDALGKFCSTMRVLGFDPKDFIDEDGYWKTGTYGTTLPKYPFECQIKKVHSRVDYENNVYQHMKDVWTNYLREGINVEQECFFNKTEVDELGIEYLHRYIDYDMHQSVEIIDNHTPRLLRFLGIGRWQEWNSPMGNIALYHDWSKTRKACIARLFRKAFARIILSQIEVCKGLRDSDIEWAKEKAFGIPQERTPNGEYVQISGELRFDGRVRIDSAPLKAPVMQAFLDENDVERFNYRVCDLVPRYSIIRREDIKSWKDEFIQPFQP